MAEKGTEANLPEGSPTFVKAPLAAESTSSGRPDKVTACQVLLFQLMLQAQLGVKDALTLIRGAQVVLVCQGRMQLAKAAESITACERAIPERLCCQQYTHIPYGHSCQRKCTHQ